MAEKQALTINLGKLTREYLFPTLEQLAQPDFQIPLHEELCSIGAKNVQAVHMYLRELEREVGKQINLHTSAIHTMVHLKSDWAISSHDELLCDWHGSAHAIPTEKMRWHYYNELHSPEGYKAAVHSLEAEVYSCQLGSLIARWCSANPQPCEFQHHCLKLEATAQANPTDFVDTPCPHYDECYGDTPFAEQRCIFADLSKGLIGSCRKDLEKQREVLRDCKEKIKDYQSCLKRAGYATQARKINTPEFTLCRSTLLRDAEFRSKVVEFDRAPDGAITIRWGVYAGETKTTHGFCKIVNLYDGDTVRIFDRETDYVLYGKRLYLTEPDFTHLVNNPEYCKVWTRLVGSKGDFQSHELNAAFDGYRRQNG